MYFVFTSLFIGVPLTGFLLLLFLFFRGNQKAQTLQYLYFMRFSIILWLFPYLFALADSGLLPFSTRSLTRGIFVPEFFPGYLCVAFFLITTGFVALVTARVTAINGGERFQAERPSWLIEYFVNDRAEKEWWPVGISLVPALSTYLYLALNSSLEDVLLSRILLGLICGTVLAGAFWYLVNAWYYLEYRQPDYRGDCEAVDLSTNAARTILFPRSSFFLRNPGKHLCLYQHCDHHKKTLEDLGTLIRKNSPREMPPPGVADVSRMPAWQGYRDYSGRFYEAQRFTFIAAAGFFLIYLTLYPLTAPMPTRLSVFALVADLIVGFVLVRIFWSGDVESPIDKKDDGIWEAQPATQQERTAEVTVQKQNRDLARDWRWFLSALALGFTLVIPGIYLLSYGSRFPTLASVLLLVILLIWILAALAFLLDRYRVPVLTFFVLMSVVPRIFHFYGDSEEHYVTTVAAQSDAAELRTPTEILGEKLAVKDAALDRPLIIVTSTGGGLHATAWTADVMRELDKALGTNSKDAESFRQHILVISTVSGSSISLAYYLDELRNQESTGRGPDFDKIATASKCSSLEAVGWGLVYYDLPKAIVPGLPWLLRPFGPSSGDEDFLKTPMFKDRTWALRRGFERNATDKYCAMVKAERQSGLTADNLSEMINTVGERLWPDEGSAVPTLSLGRTRDLNVFPAFAMNTTSAEAGDRFLLANYRLPGYSLGSVEGLPAESFLDIVNGADVPLTSAAQLSATFPYVSSAARIPKNYAPNSVHFVDGGYYDNDGTSSAIEFLRYALDAPKPSKLNGDNKAQEKANADAEKVKSTRDLLEAKAPGKKLRVLLIEIRNSVDTDEPGSAATPKALNPPVAEGETIYSSGVLDQLSKPLAAFWNAGHGSVTGRDRNGLDLLIQSHPELELRHIVFDDKTKVKHAWGIQEAQDPLSWSLTPHEREALDLDSRGTVSKCYEETRKQFLHWTEANSIVGRCSQIHAVSSGSASN